MKLKKIAALLAVAGIASPALATNGMNQAGYGPIAESMGGTSMAYDNGVAGAINNPATLGLLANGAARLDVGFGDLRPLATANGQGSNGKDYFMPGMGYIRKDGNLAWGVAIMAQGGMGTDYSNGNFWGTLQPATGGYMMGGAANLNAAMASGQSLRQMSELGVGRLIFPAAFSVSPEFAVGGSIDYVWAGMDVKWLMDGAHFLDMVPAFGGKQTFGTITGPAVQTLGSLMPGGACGPNGCINDIGWGAFDFERSGKFMQQAKGDGWAANIGFTYKATQALTVGGSYHAKTNLSDMKTGSSDARAMFNVNSTGVNPALGTGQVVLTIPGKVTIHNFQWPETYGLGAAFQANDNLLITADYKRINWASTMKNLDMRFEGSIMGMSMNLNLLFKQEWDNQDVFEFGAAYKVNPALTVRFGANLGTNPIPNKYVTPIFPAVMKNHYTGGFGYDIDKNNSVSGAFVYAPKVSVTNNWAAVSGPLGATSNANISLGSDFSYQVMYSHRF